MSAELKALRLLRARIRRTDTAQLRQEIPRLEQEISELALRYHALLRRHPFAWSRAERMDLEATWKPEIVSFLQTYNTDPELWKKLES